MRRQKFLVIILCLIIILIAAAIYFFIFSSQKGITQQNKISEIISKKQEHTICLNDGEVVKYEIKDKKRSLGDSEAEITVFINNKKTGKEIYSFQIDNVRRNYHPSEIHKCGVYATQMFNYDPKKTKQESGYKAELWRYNYNGDGEFLILFQEKISDGEQKIYKSYYSTDFRIDNDEKYIVLEKWTIVEFDKGGYSDGKDHSIVIKNLKNKEDVFVLPAKEIVKQYPNFVGNFNMRDWTKDSRYFWGDIFDGADVLAIFRIDSTNWKWELFEVPPYTMGGTALNPEYGYITYDDGPPWTGDMDFDEINKEKWLKEGKKLNFYLYNLFTKENILLTTVDDPLWNFKPNWLSDTELQYTLPSGETKIFTVK